jgi:hypothetical protein
MIKPHHRFAVLSILLCTAVLLQSCGNRSSASTSTSSEHIRGTVQSRDGHVLTVSTSTGLTRVLLAPSTLITTVVLSDRGHITHGSFLGIVSVTQPDGSRRAVEVTVVPEEMRGIGEGTYAWDLPGVDRGSKMTNGTVASSRMTNGTVTAQGGGSSLTVQYKDGASTGSQTMTVPPDIPVVAIEPGHSVDVQPGVHIFVVAHRDSEGVLSADQVVAGRNGVVPPM